MDLTALSSRIALADIRNVTTNLSGSLSKHNQLLDADPQSENERLTKPLHM